MKNKEYAIWLKPAGNEFQRLIQKYSTTYSTASFDAHITLLSGISENEESIKRKVNQLANNAQPFNTNINKVSHSDFYYRSVILELNAVPKLIGLLEEAKRIFDKTDQTTYLPHISIVYSNLSNEIRADIVQELGGMRCKNVDIISIVIIEASTDMPIEDWRIIGEFDL